MIHCPTCSAALRFEVESQKMACGHCGNRFDVASVDDNERSDAKGHQVFDQYIFACPDCGAELAVNDENDAVGFCPYCGGASMLFDRVRQTWVPDGVIPFKITKEQCKQAYVEEVRKHPFVSAKYRNPELIDSFRGIYMPFWQFKGKQQEPYAVQGTETVDGSSKDKKIRRVFDQWYETDYTITGLSHDASSSFDDHTSERLAPYDDSKTEVFHPGYLSGFYAEIGDMDQGTYERYAKERCQDFRASKLDYTMTKEELRSVETEITSLSNVLYPVWFMSYRRGNKISYAAVNGETGKVSADLPLSPLKIVGAAVVVTLALFALLNLVMGALPSIKATDVLTMCAVIALASTCFLGESCLDTLSQSLRLDVQAEVDSGEDGDTHGEHAKMGSEPSSSTASSILRFKSGFTTALMSILAVLGTMFVATDGSYTGYWRIAGCVMCLVSYTCLVLWAYGLVQFDFKSKGVLKADSASQLENGIVETYSKYRFPFIVLKAVVLASCVIAAFLGITDALGKLACYVLCVVLAVEVLAYAASQIAFQTTIAERKPPQMSKRGAFYDAH